MWFPKTGGRKGRPYIMRAGRPRSQGARKDLRGFQIFWKPRRSPSVLITHVFTIR